MIEFNIAPFRGVNSVSLGCSPADLISSFGEPHRIRKGNLENVWYYRPIHWEIAFSLPEKTLDFMMLSRSELREYECSVSIDGFTGDFFGKTRSEVCDLLAMRATEDTIIRHDLGLIVAFCGEDVDGVGCAIRGYFDGRSS